MKAFVRVGAVLLLLGVAGYLLVAGSRSTPPEPETSSTAEAVARGHARHLPPTLGSRLYQYAAPGQRRFDASQVYNPTPPPPGRAPDGVREYELVIEEDVPHEVAPGVVIPAWTFNRSVPGPVLRATEGELVRVTLVNKGKLPHTIHFHGIHPGNMDGVFETVAKGDKFVYEFDAEPFGLQLYHCHTPPLKRHIHKGLYGTFIIDPPGGRAPAKEFVMMMNGFDTNFDGENEIYAVNTVAFHYAKNPIKVKVGELIRIYLVNITEFDPINSLHLHTGMYKMFKTGTRLDYYEYTDVVMLCQGERAILEFTLKYPGLSMFHAHQSELAELGWLGMFEVTE